MAGEATVDAAAPAAASSPADTGPPVGFVAGLGLLGAGAVGLGAWQFAKGRRR